MNRILGLVGRFPQHGPQVTNAELHLLGRLIREAPTLGLAYLALLFTSRLRHPWVELSEAQVFLQEAYGVHPRTAREALLALVDRGHAERQGTRLRLAPPLQEDARPLQGDAAEISPRTDLAAPGIKEEGRKQRDPSLGASARPAPSPKGEDLEQTQPLRERPQEEVPRGEAGPPAPSPSPRLVPGFTNPLPRDRWGRPHVKRLLQGAGLWRPFRDLLLAEHYPSTYPYLQSLALKVEALGVVPFLTALTSTLEDVLGGKVARPRRLLAWKLARAERGLPVYPSPGASPPPPDPAPPPPLPFEDGQPLRLRDGREGLFRGPSGPGHFFLELEPGVVARLPRDLLP